MPSFRNFNIGFGHCHDPLLCVFRKETLVSKKVCLTVILLPTRFSVDRQRAWTRNSVRSDFGIRIRSVGHKILSWISAERLENMVFGGLLLFFCLHEKFRTIIRRRSRERHRRTLRRIRRRN